MTQELWISVFSGTHVHIYDPQPEEIFIDDIAHGLALLCRYNGQCRTFYSVAQHSVLMSLLVSEEYALWALLHDAAEAYIGDMIRPLKNTEVGIIFKQVEKKLLDVIVERFGLSKVMPEEVNEADNRMLVTEARYLLPNETKLWGNKDELPYDVTIEPWSSDFAYDIFLKRFFDLSK